MTPQGDVDLADVEVEPGRSVALAVGAEGPGLSGAVLDAATIQARIQMCAGTDSLNVASAAEIAAWHLFR